MLLDRPSYGRPLSRLVCFGYQSQLWLRKRIRIRGDGAIIKLPCTNYPNKSQPRDFHSSPVLRPESPALITLGSLTLARTGVYKDIFIKYLNTF